MFSSSLRGRSIWRKLASAIATSTIASFQESPMTSTDLAIAVQGSAKQVTLHVLLLEAGDLLTGEAARRLKGLSSAVRPAHALEAVILIHDHTDASVRLCSVMQLQNMLLQSGRPICLQVPSVEKVMATLQDFIGKLKESSPAIPTRPIPHAQLLAHATATAPNRLLAEHNINLLSDLFASIRALEKGTRTEEGQQKIRDYLDPRTARDVIDFWEDEWIA